MSDKHICYGCLYYEPTEDDCYNEEYCKKHCRWDDLPEKECQYFSPRKECKHRYEQCSESCSILCHSRPSDRGCEFWFECDLDDYPCNEKCEEHKRRYILKDKQTRLSKLLDAKNLIEDLIKYCKEEIEKIKKEE